MTQPTATAMSVTDAITTPSWPAPLTSNREFIGPTISRPSTTTLACQKKGGGFSGCQHDKQRSIALACRVGSHTVIGL